MLRKPILILPLGVAVLMLTLVTGCGDRSGGGGKPENYISSTEIIDHFKEATGELLIRQSASESPTMEILDFGNGTDEEEFDDEDSRLAGEFGAFSIYVVKRKANLKKEVNSLLSDEDDDTADYTNEPVDETTGIHWTRVDYRGDLADVEPAYFAYKVYGDNVVLSWVGDEDKATDTRWDRLNSILTDLTDK